MEAWLDNHPVHRDSVIPYEIAKTPVLRVTWPLQLSQGLSNYHTLVVYDISAPSKENPYLSPYMHFMAVNIPYNNVSQGNILLGYQPPSPPPDSGLHTYVIDVYEQETFLQINGDIFEQDFTRPNFNLQLFINQNRLHLLDRIQFETQLQSSELQSSELQRSDKEMWLKSDRIMEEDEEKYCRCVLQVASKQPASCNEDKAWYEKREGKTCYNPYAVCANTVGTTSRQCGENYNFENIPDEHLIGYASLSGIPVPQPYNRDQIIANIKYSKYNKYGK